MGRLNAVAISQEDVREAARKLVPLLREQAELTEALCRVSPMVMQVLNGSGLLRLLQPSAYGGKEESIGLLLEVLQILGSGCLSTAWVSSNAASHFWMLARWPNVVQDAIWRENSGALISSALDYAAGQADRLEDGSGYCFSGTWDFASGVDDASYVMLGALTGPERDGARRKVIGIFPRNSLDVLDTWHVCGLCGTGSKSLRGQGLAVRDDWVVDAESLDDGTAPGLRFNSAPLFRIPVKGMFPHLAAAGILGNAQGCYDEFVTGARLRRTTHSRLPADQFVAQQMYLAEAHALITSGTLLIQQDAQEATEIAKRGELASRERQLRWRMNAAYAAQQGTRAVDLLFAAYGGGGNYRANNAQRRFRDAHAAVSRNQVSWDAIAADFGSAALSVAERTC
ncbi:acyl-CoA dehydrogenase family protein [Burkholderia cenocepacia]|uniref:hypothetical protein n=1 Tax=Burkholderia cenocepacia TaxID=95486 RepID=UPI000A06D453|nr:hypothetical protein [Burkholderia cenocepacia]MCW3678779.1 hypothetical protein [Burkholderia cenocepacia]MDC6086526.1 hypothetical protein [Burkholderia cenocepacia]